MNAVAINKLLVAYQLFFIHYFYRIYTIWFLVSFPRFIFSNISFTHPSKMHPSIRRSKPSQSSSSRMLVVGNISLENLREIVGHLGTFGTLVLRSYQNVGHTNSNLGYCLVLIVCQLGRREKLLCLLNSIQLTSQPPVVSISVVIQYPAFQLKTGLKYRTLQNLLNMNDFHSMN